MKMTTLRKIQMTGTSPVALLTPEVWLCGVQYGITAKLKAFVNSLEEVEEAHRALYVKELDKDGKETGRFKIDSDEVEDVKSLRNAVRRQEEELKRLKEQAERFRNVNPEEHERLRTEAANREAREAEIRREADDRVRELEESQRQALGRKDAEIKRIKDQRDTMFLENALLPAITAENGVPEFLMPALRGRARVTERDGKLSLEILDATGAKMFHEGKDAGPETLVAEFKNHKVYAGAFKGSGAGGSGSDQQGGGGGGGGGGKKVDEKTPNPFKKELWNKSKQAALINRDAKGRIMNDDAKEQAETLAKAAGFDSLDKAMAATRPIQ